MKKSQRQIRIKKTIIGPIRTHDEKKKKKKKKARENACDHVAIAMKFPSG